MFNIPINDDNFILYASKIYDNPSCESEDEFYEDLNRVKYIKRLFFRYEGTTRILFHKSEEKYYGYIKSFVKYLDALPETIPDLDLEEIATDHRIDKELELL